MNPEIKAAVRKKTRNLVKRIVYSRRIHAVWCLGTANWGDALNPVLIEWLSGRKPRCDTDPDMDKFLVIGSVLEFADRNTTVWGSGFIKAGQLVKERPKAIRAVRGPLSRASLLDQGIDCPEVYGDPALLLPRLYNPDVPKQYEIGLIPHYADKSHPWLDRYRNDPKVRIIDVESDTWRFVQEVKSCELIVSSSLHGVICADSYGVPAIWMELSDKVIGNGFKFFDYFASIQHEVSAPIVPNENMSLADVVSRHQPYRVQFDLDRLLLACPFLCSKERNRLIGKSRVG